MKHRSHKKNAGSFSDHALNVVLVIVLVYAVSRPGGLLRAWYDSWRTNTTFTKLAAEHWTELSQTRAVLGQSNTGARLVVEFGDYECPACRRAHSEVANALAEDSSLVVGFRHHPLTDIHPLAEGAARAAICAEFQGQFHAMHTVLMETTEWREDEDWKKLARQAGVPDVSQFETCLSGEQVDRRLQEDVELADALNVTATPTFFHGSGAQVGFIGQEELRQFGRR